MPDDPAVKPSPGGRAPAAPASPPAQPKPESGQEGAPGNGSAPVAPSVLDKLREKRNEIAEGRTVELAIPGYGDTLVARYRAIPYREVTKARKKNAKRSGSDPDAELRFGTSMLARACDAMLVRPDEDGGLVELQTTVPEFGDEPVRYDKRLAEAVGMDPAMANSASAVIRFVFGADDSTWALMRHAEAYEEWLASNETDADF
jgi:hypothetical protein